MDETLLPVPKKPEIRNVRYIHDNIIDAIIAFPAISQNELCAQFRYSPSWMSIIMNSDSFKERLAERKAELVDPALRASVEERLEAVAKRALDKLLERLDQNLPISNSDLISAAKLGVGDRNQRPAAPQNQNNLYVVQLPPPAKTSDEWLSTRSHPRGVSDAVEIAPRGLTNSGES